MFEIYSGLFFCFLKNFCGIEYLTEFCHQWKFQTDNSFFICFSLSISTQDDRYWARRRKNNFAAKRSRDARRLKENQIAIRAGFLEKENGALRQEVADLRKELGRCKNILAKYEARHGPL